MPADFKSSHWPVAQSYSFHFAFFSVRELVCSDMSRKPLRFKRSGSTSVVQTEHIHEKSSMNTVPFHPCAHHLSCCITYPAATRLPLNLSSVTGEDAVFTCMWDNIETLSMATQHELHESLIWHCWHLLIWCFIMGHDGTDLNVATASFTWTKP